MQNAIIWLYFLLLFVPALALVGGKALDFRESKWLPPRIRNTHGSERTTKNSSDLVNNGITIGSFNSELSKMSIQVLLKFLSVGPETLSLHESDSPKLFDFNSSVYGFCSLA